MTLYEFDNQYRKDYPVICGVDEAGRGPLAGDVFAAAVVFDEGTVIEGINDSKKLTAKKREQLFDVITEKAKYYSIKYATVAEIEEINILQGAMLAMKRAVVDLDIEPDLVLVDGNKKPDIKSSTVTVVHGDALSQSIAAASILAKVSRDRYMLEMAEKYPEYQFEKHKGYGTKLHYEMIDKYGICEIHRPSFLKKYYAKKND
ncbi:MAG: ribonuclease HII [Oscillospiraceae bacterium]